MVTINSISVTPSPLSIAGLGTGNVVVTSHLSDGSTQDVSQLATFGTAALGALSFKGNAITSLINKNEKIVVEAIYEGLVASMVVTVTATVPTPSPQPSPVQLYSIQVRNLTKAQSDSLMTSLSSQHFVVSEFKQS